MEEIIDGVNVSGCEAIYDDNKCQYYYDTDNWKICGYDKCSDHPNCYYKQLKRKEADNKHLKDLLDNALEEKEKLMQALEKIEEIAISRCYSSIPKGADILQEDILQIIKECK